MGEVASHLAVACCNGRLRGIDSWRSLLSARTSIGRIVMVGPSCDLIAQEERSFHCIISCVLFPSEDRNEGRFEKCGQVCVQINQVDDKLKGTG